MHKWGDEWFKKYGPDLYEAIDWIEEELRKSGIQIIGKEKWGSYCEEHCFFDENRLEEQYEAYNKTFQLACQKWPYLTDELISDIDHYDLIKPGKYGEIDGKKIHDKYWKVIYKKGE